jgi:hypothetical protein
MIRQGDTVEINAPPPTTRRVRVEYEVVHKVTYVGDAVLDVPNDKMNADGTIDLDWARDNVGELERSDLDVLPARLGGGETAHWYPMKDEKK